MNENFNQIIKQEKPVNGLEPYMKEFANDRLSDLKEISSLINDNDLENIAKIAHKWKGFCEPYGFNHLAYLAKNLEKACKSNEKASVKQFFSDISNYLSVKIMDVNNKY